MNLIFVGYFVEFGGFIWKKIDLTLKNSAGIENYFENVEKEAESCVSAFAKCKDFPKSAFD